MLRLSLIRCFYSLHPTPNSPTSLSFRLKKLCPRTPSGRRVDNTSAPSRSTETRWEFLRLCLLLSLFKNLRQSLSRPLHRYLMLIRLRNSCNAGVRGDNGGSIGLMQITKDKCGGRSLEACHDPDFNIRTGAAYVSLVHLVFSRQKLISRNVQLLQERARPSWRKRLPSSRTIQRCTSSPFRSSLEGWRAY